MSARKVNSSRYLRRLAADRAAAQVRRDALAEARAIAYRSTDPGRQVPIITNARTIRSDARNILLSRFPTLRTPRNHADAPIFQLPFRVDRYADGSPTGFIFDAEGTTVASRNHDTGRMIPRGWGKIQYLPGGGQIMDEWIATFDLAGCGVEDPDLCLVRLHALAGWNGDGKG